MLDFILLGAWTALCFALAFYRWRLLVPLLFFLICVEGYLANYLYPLRSPLLARMVLLVVLYSTLVLSREVRKIPRFPLPVLGVFLLVTIFQFLNPLSPGLFVSLLGLSLLLIHIPLLWVAYSYFRQKSEVIEFLYLNILFALPVNLVGIGEYFWGYGAILPVGGRYVPLTTPGSLGQTYVRVISTFAAPGLYAAYLMTIIVLCAVLLYSQALQGWKRRVTFVSLLFAAVGLLASGSRGSFVVACVMVGILFWFRGGLQRMVRVAIVLGGVLVLGLLFLGERVQARFADITLQEIFGRFYGLFWYRVGEVVAENPWGHGLGVASVASRHLTGGQVSVPLVESYFLKLLYEVGFIGLVLFVCLVSVVLYRQFSMIRRLREERLRWIGSAFFVFEVLSFLLCSVGTVLDSPPLPIFFWFFVGTIFKLPRLDAAVAAELARGTVAARVPTCPQPVLGRPG